MCVGLVNLFLGFKARRREDERRRTQEIKFNKEDGEAPRMAVGTAPSAAASTRDEHDTR